MHYPLLSLPFFHDEAGFYVPASLDLARQGEWISTSTPPNVHPPGLPLLVTLVVQTFGFHREAIRMAMLLVSAGAFLCSFLLTIELTRGLQGTPAFIALLFLMASPLLYIQSLSVHPEMLAMLLTALTLLLQIRGHYAASALACIGLCMAKETSVVLPLCLAWQHWRAQRRLTAGQHLAGPLLLGMWLLVLRMKTGSWLGDAAFAHYNAIYTLDPLRMLVSVLRRVWTLFGADFHWLSTLALAAAMLRGLRLNRPEWRLCGAYALAHVMLVSVTGGAVLERYLLPIFPILMALFAAAWVSLPRNFAFAGIALATVGMFASLFFNPPWPFPLENNLAIVHSVQLQQTGAFVLAHRFPRARIATVWPFSDALRNPDLGYVRRPLQVTALNAQTKTELARLNANEIDIFVAWSRSWEPPRHWLSQGLLQGAFQRLSGYEEQLDGRSCARILGFERRYIFGDRGHWLEILVRPGWKPVEEQKSPPQPVI
jgi:hypothetical protein